LIPKRSDCLIQQFDGSGIEVRMIFVVEQLLAGGFCTRAIPASLPLQ